MLDCHQIIHMGWIQCFCRQHFQAITTNFILTMCYLYSQLFLLLSDNGQPWVPGTGCKEEYIKLTTKKTPQQPRIILPKNHLYLIDLCQKRRIPCKICKKENYFLRHLVKSKRERKLFQITLYHIKDSQQLQINIFIALYLKNNFNYKEFVKYLN